MSRKVFKYSAVIASLLLTAFFAGCGSDNKDGSVSSVAKVDEALCAQCHGSAREQLTGRVIYDDYAQSVHALNSVGCQDCHGGGAEHNGVGPIPFPKPNQEQCRACHDSGNFPKLVTNYTSSMHFGVKIEEGQTCNRCHTHQGAVLAAQGSLGFTGGGDTLAAGVLAGIAPGDLPSGTGEPIKCDTCHITHKPQDLRFDTTWNPATAVKTAAQVAASTTNTNDQYKLCTQCHTYINAAGRLTGSGNVLTASTFGNMTTTKVGHHETKWYRVIASTHYSATPSSANGISGYGVRFTLPDGTPNPNPCFDCHGHEAKTNTNNITNTTPTTIYTDWAQSAHAGGLLQVKYSTARTSSSTGAALTDAVMQTVIKFSRTTPNLPTMWTHGGTGGCGRCHSPSGLSSYLDTRTNAISGSASVLTCNGCHSNAGYGQLRALKGTSAATDYATFRGYSSQLPLYYGKKHYPDVAASNICIVCHSMDETAASDPAAGGVTPKHHGGAAGLPAAAVMYVKKGFLNLSTGGAASGQSSAAYRKTLMSDQDVVGGISSTHRKLGTPAEATDTGHFPAGTPAAFLSGGPCVVCHMTGSHTLKIDQKAITAVCNNCHTSEGGHDITTIAAFNQYFIEPQREVYFDALKLGVEIFNSKNTGITLAFNSFNNIIATNTSTGLAVTQTDWNTAATVAPYNSTDIAKLMGAVNNLIFLSADKAAYVHARTYTRRLIYDSLDYLDDASLDASVGATAIATDNATFGKGATAYTDATLTTLATGTTEAMTFLIKWSRTDGSWSTPERP